MHTLKIIKHDVKDCTKKNFDNVHDKLTEKYQKIDYVGERLIYNPNSNKFSSWFKQLLKKERNDVIHSKELARKKLLVDED